MKKRMFIMLAVVIVFIAIIAGIKVFQIRTAMAHQGSFQPPPEAVTTVIAKEEVWSATLNAIGSVAAVNGVTVGADLPGVVDQIAFESGRNVSKGEVLVRLDSRQELAQLAAAQAQLELSRVEWKRAQGMLANRILSQANYDTAAAQYKQAEARAGEIRATIARKVIRAPFAGVLGLRQVNRGEYLAAGAPIVSLQAIRPVYINFTLPQQDLAQLRSGAKLEATSDALRSPESGRITAIDSVIDENTRSVHAQGQFENASGALRPGMYVQTSLANGTSTRVITLPTSAISYAPFGDSVFIVELVKGPDGKSFRGVRQQFVKLSGSRGDQVGVASGVKPGEEVVTSGVFKLRPGAAVNVNNDVQPANSKAPRPEDS